MKSVNKSNIRNVSFVNSRNRINKRGQQMTLGTIIAIVLGIAVLVFLIFGFSTGWNNMWDRITAFGGGSANVDTVVQGCEVACASNSVNSFCVRKRTVTFEDGRSNTGSCKTFFDFKKEVGIKSCSIDCSSVTPPTLGGDGVSETDAAEQKVDEAQKRVAAAAERVDEARKAVDDAGGSVTAVQETALDSAENELEDARDALDKARDEL